jgi:short-subunit dehydrogenase
MTGGRRASDASASGERRSMEGRARTALVTGASSGIGAALARRLAAHGYDLVLVARRADRLEALASAVRTQSGVKVRVVPVDLAKPGAVAALAAAMKRARRPIDLLVNDAGVLAVGDFAAMPPARHAAIVALNVAALTQMLAHFVPPMVARGRGRVLNVASIAAFQPVPTLATYAASKAYVLSISESLAEELRGSGVTVTVLCPGLTATGMLAGAKEGVPALARLPSILVGDAEAVAAEGVEACLAGEVIRVPGAVNQAVILAGRATPRALLRRVSGEISRRIR